MKQNRKVYCEGLTPITSFKLQFDYLTEAGKTLFYRRMFAPFEVGEPSDEEALHLRRIPNLTPGDFRTVRQSLHYLTDAVTHAMLLEGLDRESAVKPRSASSVPLGFSPG